jgi:hypothetical protein
VCFSRTVLTLINPLCFDQGFRKKEFQELIVPCPRRLVPIPIAIIGGKDGRPVLVVELDRAGLAAGTDGIDYRVEFYPEDRTARVNLPRAEKITRRQFIQCEGMIRVNDGAVFDNIRVSGNFVRLGFYFEENGFAKVRSTS